jgi:superfamily II RNA helicase
MVLNLLLSHSPEQVKGLLGRSFASYLLRKAAKKKSRKDPRRILWSDFLHHLDFLKDSGFVTGSGELTEKGRWTSQLRVDQPLLIAEGFELGILPVTEPRFLAAIIATFVSERESDTRINKKRVHRPLLDVFYRVVKGLRPFAWQMQDRGFEVRPFHLRPAAAINGWANGEQWEKVQSLAEMEEGDLVMLILRTADNLRHIRALRQVFPDAAETADRAIELILREPVVFDL